MVLRDTESEHKKRDDFKKDCEHSCILGGIGTLAVLL